MHISKPEGSTNQFGQMCLCTGVHKHTQTHSYTHTHTHACTNTHTSHAKKWSSLWGYTSLDIHTGSMRLVGWSSGEKRERGGKRHCNEEREGVRERETGRESYTHTHPLELKLQFRLESNTITTGLSCLY